jgi:NDP-sugar pyrophosphorylase family protein
VKAFILAGGLGTRLRPQFGDVPKPLAPVGGRPFLERQIEWLTGQGIATVVLCLGHGAEQVIQTLGDGSRWNARLEFSVETEPLGTAGALRLAARWVEGPAVVLNGDTFAPCSPWSLERARWEHGMLGAVALFQAADAAARGRVECDAGQRVLRFVEKDPDHRGGAWVNGGLYTLDPRVWRWLPEAGSLEREVLPRLAASGYLLGHPVQGDFYDIGTPEEWQRAERYFTA